MRISRRRFNSGASALLFSSVPSLAHPQEARLDTATIVVGFPPGGGADVLARIMAESMRGAYADAVIVENRTGAAGRIAAAYVKSRPGDGKCLLYTPPFPMVIHPHVYDKMPYDALKDFQPVAAANYSVIALAIGPAVPAEVVTLSDFVAWIEANPEKASFGAPAGSTQHFVGAMFARDARIKLQFVGYPGGAPSVVNALGGHIACVFGPLQEVIINRPRLRILAISAPARSMLAPDIPTFVEQGFGKLVVKSWSGFFAPRDTPQKIVGSANAAVAKVLAQTKVVESLAKLGVEPLIETPQQFTKTVEDSWEFYRSIVAETGFKAEN